MISQDLRIFITGATSGIGLDAANRLATEGTKLFLTGKNPDKLENLLETIQSAGRTDVSGLAGDLTSPAFVSNCVSQAVAQMGGIDVVIHAAGVGHIKPFLESSDADFLRVTNINYRGTFLVAQETCRVMAAAKSGLFITFPGILGKAVMKNASIYASSKWAVTGLIKTLALELQRSGVRFSMLHLGGVDSPFWNDIGMAVDRSKMIPVSQVTEALIGLLKMPRHLVATDITIQPDSHQL